MNAPVHTPVHFYVNGKPVTCEADEADMSLLDFLHERLHLSGTKFACGAGLCRACTVALRRQPKAALEKASACSLPVSSLRGVAVNTVEALGSAKALAPLQRAFLDHFAFQCGYCTPGFLMAASVLLDQLQRKPVPAAELDALIVQALGENICRCTGYVRYLDAVREVAQRYVKK